MSADPPYRSPELLPRDSGADSPAAPSGQVRYIVLTFLCLAATLSYIPRISIGVAEQAIREDLDLTRTQMGWVLSAFFWSYALFQVPSGWLSQAAGSRRALALFAAGWSACTAWMAMAAGGMSLLASRLMMGVAQAGVFPAATQSVAHWFPKTQRGLASGSLGSFMSLGSAIGLVITGYLISAIGWRWTFGLYSVPGFIWAAGFYFWFRDRPENHPKVRPAELALIAAGRPAELSQSANAPAEPTPWLALATSPALWFICGQQVFRAAGYTFYGSWFATFLKEGRGVSTDWMAGLLNMLPVLVVVPASFLGGVASDWILARTGSLSASRKSLATGSILACSAAYFLVYAFEDVWLMVGMISLGSFCVSLAGPCAYSITIDMGGRHVSVVFSIMNMAGNLGAAVFPPLVAWLVELAGWNSVLLLVGGIYLASALCWMALRPEGTILQQSCMGRGSRVES
jgi:MFS family permease